MQFNRLFSGGRNKTVLRLSIILMLIILLIISPVLTGHFKEHILYSRIHDFKDSKTYIFASIKHCMKKGFKKSECKNSKLEALEFKEDIDTTFVYSSRNKCKSKHQSCERVKVLVSDYEIAGKQAYPDLQYVITYQPPIVAWQVDAKDISEAVPLYQSAQDDTLIRIDGKKFEDPS